MQSEMLYMLILLVNSEATEQHLTNLIIIITMYYGFELTQLMIMIISSLYCNGLPIIVLQWSSNNIMIVLLFSITCFMENINFEAKIIIQKSFKNNFYHMYYAL